MAKKKADKRISVGKKKAKAPGVGNKADNASSIMEAKKSRTRFKTSGKGFKAKGKAKGSTGGVAKAKPRKKG